MNLERYSKPVLRIGLSLVFLYFGFAQIISPSDWVSFVPSSVLIFGMSAENFVMVNSFFEISLGVLMLFGLFTRVVSFLLALHLVGITLSIGFNPLGIRDFGLTVATFVVFLNGVDWLCLDRKWKKYN